MMAAKAPAGCYTHVRVQVQLQHTSRSYAWRTPMALLPALHRAAGWAKDAMKAERVKGRSKIVRLDVGVQTLEGGIE